jgi:hypothetical protein
MPVDVLSARVDVLSTRGAAAFTPALVSKAVRMVADR